MWPRALAALGGIALLVSLAFPWYESTDGELSVHRQRRGRAPGELDSGCQPGGLERVHRNRRRARGARRCGGAAGVRPPVLRPSHRRRRARAGRLPVALAAGRGGRLHARARRRPRAGGRGRALRRPGPAAARRRAARRPRRPRAAALAVAALVRAGPRRGSVPRRPPASPGAIIAVLVGEEDGTVASAWELLTVIDIALVPLALLALAVPLTALLARGPAKPVAAAVLASAFGWIAVLLVGRAGPVHAGRPRARHGRADRARRGAGGLDRRLAEPARRVHARRRRPAAASPGGPGCGVERCRSSAAPSCSARCSCPGTGSPGRVSLSLTAWDGVHGHRCGARRPGGRDRGRAACARRRGLDRRRADRQPPAATADRRSSWSSAYGGFVGLAGALSAAWPGRLRVGEVLAGVGGLVLVLALGLEWYEFSLIDAVGPNDPDPVDPVNGWIERLQRLGRLHPARRRVDRPRPRSFWPCPCRDREHKSDSPSMFVSVRGRRRLARDRARRGAHARAAGPDHGRRGGGLDRARGRRHRVGRCLARHPAP